MTITAKITLDTLSVADLALLWLWTRSANVEHALIDRVGLDAAQRMMRAAEAGRATVTLEE